MAVRSWRLSGPLLLAGGTNELLTVPDGRTAIVKSVRVVNGSDATRLIRMTIGAVSLGNALLWDSPIPADRVFSDTTWWVVNAGETLNAAPDFGGALVVTISGALLSSVPS